MQTKTGAFLSMGRIPQFIGHAAVAAGLLAGGASLLNAGGAMAAPIDFPPPYPGQGPVGPDNVTTSTLGIPTPNPSIGVGDVNLTYFGVVGDKNTYQVDADFDGLGTPDAGGLAGPYSGTFRYSITSPVHPFVGVGLSQNIVAFTSGASVTKDIYADAGFTIPLIPLGTLSGTDTFNVTTPITPTNTLYIKDTYTGTSTAGLDNFINTYQTPGPLPILGAGAAFGFSRKLRGRIKAGRTA